jgi:hypothetical protein
MAINYDLGGLPLEALIILPVRRNSSGTPSLLKTRATASPSKISSEGFGTFGANVLGRNSAPITTSCTRTISGAGPWIDGVNCGNATRLKTQNEDFNG